MDRRSSLGESAPIESFAWTSRICIGVWKKGRKERYSVGTKEGITWNGRESSFQPAGAVLAYIVHFLQCTMYIYLSPAGNKPPSECIEKDSSLGLWAWLGGLGFFAFFLFSVFGIRGLIGYSRMKSLDAADAGEWRFGITIYLSMITCFLGWDSRIHPGGACAVTIFASSSSCTFQSRRTPPTRSAWGALNLHT